MKTTYKYVIRTNVEEIGFVSLIVENPLPFEKGQTIVTNAKYTEIGNLVLDIREHFTINDIILEQYFIDPFLHYIQIYYKVLVTIPEDRLKAIHAYYNDKFKNEINKIKGLLNNVSLD